MASSSGTSSGSPSLNQTSCSNEDLQTLLDQRKRKRMISNRESARRSRMRKQKQLNDLIAQSSQLRSENQQITSSIGITTQHYLHIETENSVLKAQVGELRHRLESLNEIISFLSPMGSGGGHGVFGIGQLGFGAMVTQQPVMASSGDLFHC
ncbi:bZIP transcription factor 11-like [Punica granatum]|uniref:BZIP domain-containing protein n=2 Tax=Punica granatum TaxID=22663 RepID=A0A218XG24_PUNGR|nr:bZIP transcription factor 11-like [Punica granatum]XP_031393350.1 bZIP transcription factor 11-like [Punica granatum]OWM83874.1 hypothetical protein CDL15_Pgr004305 [Punica granatum]PKI59489.1 hypothetical protein CRG98_020120 [Punica granatum]